MDFFDWPALPANHFVSGRLATEEDVNEGRAVFFINGDAVPADMLIPQYALYADEPKKSPQPGILIQAEETIDGCMIGARLLDGTHVVATIADFIFLGQEVPAQ